MEWRLRSSGTTGTNSFFLFFIALLGMARDARKRIVFGGVFGLVLLSSMHSPPPPRHQLLSTPSPTQLPYLNPRLPGNSPPIRPHRHRQPRGIHKPPQIEPQRRPHLRARRVEPRRRLVQQTDVAVRVRGHLGGRVRAGVRDGRGDGRREQVDAVDGVFFGGRGEARDQGVQVGAAGAGGGVLEVCGAGMQRSVPAGLWGAGEGVHVLVDH